MEFRFRRIRPHLLPQRGIEAGARRRLRSLLPALWLFLPAVAVSARPQLNPVWQLGEFFTDAEEFQAITDAIHIHTVVPGIHKRALPVPRFLGGAGSGNCRSLRLRFRLPKGSYALIRSVKEPAEQPPLLCQVFFNARELACLYTAPLGRELVRLPASAAGLGSLDDPPRLHSSVRVIESAAGYQCALFPLVCTESGDQELLLSMEAEVNVGKRLELDALALVPCSIEPRPHSLRQDVPGRVFADLWGWQATTWYQRRKPAGPAYFQEKIIDESFVRGANFVQLHPSLDQPQWLKAGFDPAALLRTIHDHDMLVDEHCFPQQRKTADEMLAWLGQWAPISANFPEYGWKGSVDGFEGEAFNALFEDPASLKSLTDFLWRWNPAAWANHAGFPCTASWLSRPKYRTPNYIKGPVCLHFLGLDLGSEEYKIGMEGYDDKLPLFRPFAGCQGLHTASQKIFLGYQADCRVEGIEVSRNPARKWGGRTRPDWILKQNDDFFRPRAQWPDDPHESAIYWLGEPPETLPLEQREFVYAASQDPIKHAMAASHAFGGAGGALHLQMEEWKRKAGAYGIDTAKAEWWQMRRRSEFPAETQFIQNAYLRLNLFPDREGGVLQYDLERLAHFDSDSLSLPLTLSFLSAPWPGSRLPERDQDDGVSRGMLRHTLKVEKAGGHLAVLGAEMTVSSQAGTIREARKYLSPNDAPYLVLDLERTSDAYGGPVSLGMGCDGYDTLIAAEKTLREAATFEGRSIPSVLRFRDSAGFKPDLAFLLLDAGRTSSIRWEPGRSLILAGAARDKLKFAWVIPTDLFDGQDLVLLRSALADLVRPLRVGVEGARLNNKYGVPHIAIAKIQSQTGGPYLVQENGWWTARGAQRSLSESDRADYIKIYLSRGATARVLPYGFIDGAAKPGYGCQYSIALRDVKGNAAGASCSARVFSVTPFLFAPRIEFAHPVARVELNGRPWHYFDDRLVFLPNQPGTCDLRVWYGRPTEPAVARTYAVLRDTAWDGQALRFTAGNQEWVGEMPPDVFYCAWIRTPGGAPSSTKNALLVESRQNLCLVRFRPGKVELLWK